MLQVAAAITRPVVVLSARLARPVGRLWRFLWLSAHSRGQVHATTQFDGPVHVPAQVDLSTGQHCRLGRDVFFETPGGRIRLGSNVRINMGCVLVAYKAIDIGDDCLIGEYVSIRDANHGTAPDRPMRLQDHAAAPIRLGCNVWIGRGAVLLKGVTIGDGAVVAANSVVTRDVAPGTLVGGAPARWIKTLAGAPLG